MLKYLDADFWANGGANGEAHINIEVEGDRYDYHILDFDGTTYEGSVYNFKGTLLDLFGRIIDGRAVLRED